LVSITTGIDIIEVKRFRDISFKQNNSFYKKIFDSKEIEYCLKFKDPYPHFAGKFAVKESFQKAIRKPIPMIEIHTNHGDLGEPLLTCKKIKCERIEISISHEKNYAVATSIIIW
jgi:holo-[acyl-carrier protein] synthase